MLKLILFSMLFFSGVHGFSINEINSFVKKSENYIKKYKEDYTKEPSSLHNVLKNNSILKKKIYNSLECDKIYKNKVVDTCYSFKNKGALAVAYTVDGNLVHVNNIEKRWNWHYNKEIPKRYRSSNSDYIRSGYDKGHCAFDSVFDYDSKVLYYTYDLNINAVPMAAKVNRKTWIKSEYYTKKIATKLGRVNVIDYMVYSSHPKKIGRGQISVPTGMFKIIYNKEKDFMRCFYYENDLNVNVKSDKLKNHIVDCQDVF